MMPVHEVKRLARGFSLVELLVAMVLGLVLVTAALQVFIGNRQTQLAESSVARVQEAGRLAMDFISDDLRQAGFSGAGDLRRSKIAMGKAPTSDLCTGKTKPTDVLNVATGPDYYDAFVDNAIRVYSRSASGAWPSTMPGTTEIPQTVRGKVREGTDLISVWYAEDTGATIPDGAGYTETDNIPITYGENPPPESCIHEGELVMLSASSGSVLFKVSNAPACTGSVTLQHDTTANCSASLGTARYGSFSRVMKIVHRLYYVGDSGRKDAQGQIIWSLYRVQFANGGGGSEDPMELVEGVEYLKVAAGQRILDGFGVDTGKIRYVTPANLDARALKSMRIGVLVQGLDAIRTEADTSSYELLTGISVSPASSKSLRRTFSTNVELRNRAQ